MKAQFLFAALLSGLFISSLSNSQTPESMEVILISKFGGPVVLELQQIPVPVPAEDEILIRVVFYRFRIVHLSMLFALFLRFLFFVTF